ncbi:MAG: hypothetical protein IKD86_01140 [Firmicutes bacterium]|nr:hypothetical protein [Bacillota bacterium]
MSIVTQMAVKINMGNNMENCHGTGDEDVRFDSRPAEGYSGTSMKSVNLRCGRLLRSV